MIQPFKKLYSAYTKLAFTPNLFSLLFNPYHIVRKNLYDFIKKHSIKFQGKILDVGCGQKPYENLFINVDEYIGLEVNQNKGKANFYYDGEIFPFESNSFDGAFSSQVLEHVFNPDLFLSEINRVLKDGSYFLITVPFIWDEHEQPYDYARYSSYGLKFLLNRNGFEVIEHQKSACNFSAISQIINAYFYKKTSRFLQYRLFRLLFSLFIFMPCNLTGIIMKNILPKNVDLFLDNLVFCRKKNV